MSLCLRSPRARLFERVIFLVLFTIAIGALLRDHSALPVGKLVLHRLPHATAYQGINHLGGAATPFLRAGALQPVWWFGWQREAFATAEILERPILLYSGAAWSELCQYLERHIFSAPDVADMMNRYVIPIRVDRELLPDVDTRYRFAARVLGGGRGEALLVFLTPSGEIFFASDALGDDVNTWVELPEIIRSVAGLFREQQSIVESTAATLRGQFRSYFIADFSEESLPKVEAVQRYIADTRQRFDATTGGFRDQIGQWPDPATLRLYLRMGYEFDAGEASYMAVLALRRLADGGVYDHLVGGFHRGSRDAAWRAPYFGKRLLQNAQLLRLYTDAYVQMGEARFREVADATVSYLLQRLRDPVTGAFFASDIVTAPQATWTQEAIFAALQGRERQVAMLVFGIEREPRLLAAHPRHNVLARVMGFEAVGKQLGWTAPEVETIFHRATHTLRQRLTQRDSPPLDTTLYADANGGAIAALFRAGTILGRPEAIQAAQQALMFWLRQGWGRFGFQHSLTTGDAEYYLSDQANMLDALLEAYQATAQRRWLDAASQLATLIEQQYRSELLAGFYDRPTAPRVYPLLGMVNDPFRPYFDLIGFPSNGHLALGFDQLAYLTGNDDWRVTADGIILGLTQLLGESLNRSVATVMNAVLYHLKPPQQVFLVGASDDPQLMQLANAARMGGGMGTLIQQVDGTAKREGITLPSPMKAHLASLSPERLPVAVVCRRATCQAPVADPVDLLRILGAFPGL